MSRPRRWLRRRPSGRIIVANDRKTARKTPDFSLPLSKRIDRNDHKYFAPASASISATSAKTRDGGGFSATNVSLRWSPNVWITATNTGLKCFLRCSLKIEKKRPDRAAVKIAQEPAFELEEYPEHLRNREDHLAVRDIEEEHLPHPLPPFLQTLGMAGRTEAACLAGKHQKLLHAAVRTADLGEPAAGIAAVKKLLDDALEDRSEIAICLLETFLIFRDEALKIIEKHPIENRALRMTRTIDARHIQDKRSRNGPGKNKGRFPGADARIRGRNSPRFLKKTSTFVDAKPEKNKRLERDVSRILFPRRPAGGYLK